MDSELGGWLTLTINLLAVIVLGVAIAYGSIAYRRFRIRRRNETLGDPARREG
jgi:hypothetical protein